MQLKEYKLKESKIHVARCNLQQLKSEKNKRLEAIKAIGGTV